MDPRMQALLERAGIAFDSSFGNPRLIGDVGGNRTYRDIIGLDRDGALVAMDAAFPLVTQSNSGIPAMLSTYLDPKLIEVLIAPMKAAEAAGGEKNRRLDHPHRDVPRDRIHW